MTYSELHNIGGSAELLCDSQTTKYSDFQRITAHGGPISFIPLAYSVPYTSKPKKAVRSVNFNMLIQARKLQVPMEKEMVSNCFRRSVGDFGR